MPGMKESRFGRIINKISTSVIQPITGLGVSNTTRGAVANWGRTLAGELAPFGITVNNILPGYTNTDRLQSLFKRWSDRDGISIEEVQQRVKKSIPMGQFAQPDEIAAMVGFFGHAGGILYFRCQSSRRRCPDSRAVRDAKNKNYTHGWHGQAQRRHAFR